MIRNPGICSVSGEADPRHRDALRVGIVDDPGGMLPLGLVTRQAVGL